MVCQRCGRTFTRSQAEINRGRNKFCSRLCSDLYKKESADRFAERVLRLDRKQCKICGRTRNLKYFPVSKNSRTGHYSYCYECKRKINREQDKKRYAKRKEYSRIAYLKRTYNLSQDEYYALTKSQNGGCAICMTKIRLAVDHDHKTGKIRGLLCHNCNRGLGMFKDSVVSLMNAVEYLKN